MMRKEFALIMVILLVLTVVPEVIAQTGVAAEKSLFQIASDSIGATGKRDPSQPAGPVKVEIFRELKTNIDTWNNTSPAAKLLSLRNNREELARRRGL